MGHHRNRKKDRTTFNFQVCTGTFVASCHCPTQNRILSCSFFLLLHEIRALLQKVTQVTLLRHRAVPQDLPQHFAFMRSLPFLPSGFTSGITSSAWLHLRSVWWRPDGFSSFFFRRGSHGALHVSLQGNDASFTHLIKSPGMPSALAPSEVGSDDSVCSMTSKA